MEWDPDQPSPETVGNFALMETEPGALERYWRLAVETSRYQKRLKADGHLDYPMWIDESLASHVPRFLVPRIAPEHRDEGLFARWAEWQQEYERIHASSRKWRLKEMISLVSETHSCMSWPNRWERAVWDWALADKPACPFDDRRQIIDSGFRDRMCSLIEECDGFLYRCEESGRVVFAPTGDLLRIWTHQDHLAAIDRARPFGFFHDLSRPNSQCRMRDLTAFEEHAYRTIGEQKRPGSRLRELARRLRRLFRQAGSRRRH